MKESKDYYLDDGTLGEEAIDNINGGRLTNVRGVLLEGVA